MARAELKVSTVDLSGNGYGYWCDRCNLPSVWQHTRLVVVNGRPHSVIWAGCCEECGEITPG